MESEFRNILPGSAAEGHLVGRVWDPFDGGPKVVMVQGQDVYDLSPTILTMSELLEGEDPVRSALKAAGVPRWSLGDLVTASLGPQQEDRPHLLAPLDLQVVKACGVTFVESMVERVIEERCGGDASKAAEVRALVGEALGGSLAELRPGSPDAQHAKEVLQEQGMWSQYLEVGIGPDPEVFTKAPVLSSVGYGSRIGVPTFSAWSNPEPELVLVADSQGEVRGATLGNDVNLRDVEGRSALLLGMAKDNNASSAIGPFIRRFDEDFTLESLREEEIRLEVYGEDGYVLEGSSNVGRISRPFEELVNAVRGPHHQYPDGFGLFTGTLFAPTQDRSVEGLGFTHKPGDKVVISSDNLGCLVNTTGVTEELPPWKFGIRSLLSHLLRMQAPLADLSG